MSQLTSKSCFVTTGKVYDDDSVDGIFFPEKDRADEYIRKELSEDPLQTFYVFTLDRAVTGKVDVVNVDLGEAKT